MPIPKSVTRQIGDSGLKIVNNVDRCSYTINELCRAALRDVGKYVVITANKKAQKLHGGGLKKTHRVKGTRNGAFQFWVRKNEKHTNSIGQWGIPDLQIGIAHETWYGINQELGTNKMPKKGILMASTQENIANIIKIESQYLSSLENEAAALAKISEGEYRGTEDEDSALT